MIFGGLTIRVICLQLMRRQRMKKSTAAGNTNHPPPPPHNTNTHHATTNHHTSHPTSPPISHLTSPRVSRTSHLTSRTTRESARRAEIVTRTRRGGSEDIHYRSQTGGQSNKRWQVLQGTLFCFSVSTNQYIIMYIKKKLNMWNQ